MNTKQGHTEQAAAVKRRTELYDLRYRLVAKRDHRGGLTDRERQLLTAVDTELLALRQVGSSQTGRWREPAIVSQQGRPHRRRPSMRPTAGSIHVFGGGLPGSGR